ncbi:EthD family reductase [Nocardioides lijunqiniae]|uniref:EthD family reductase n=1 Tax=Nocardioides lijunqiniae TaxID=2760832 RepID=UPI001878DA45|nr:EthD family reductase [Nocardioides lijunqiniae]
MHRLTVQYFDPADGETFLADYRERHVPLAQAIPGLDRLTLTTPRGDGAPYLQAELCFTNRDALKAGLSSPEMGAAAADAETYDVARKVTFTGEVEEI